MNRSIHWFLLILSLTVLSCRGKVIPSETRKELPKIFPDYTGVTIPATSAPLNFKMEEPVEIIDAVIKGKNNEEIHVQSKEYINIPPSDWKKMLSQLKGDSMIVTVSAYKDRRWIQFAPFAINVSNSPIDYGLVYRLIAPGYEVYSKMGIYERDLSTYKQRPLLENTLLPGNCMNCHSFCQTTPGQMSLHIRGEKGGTILKTEQKMSFLNTKTNETIGNCVYPYWHPSGEYIAYSVNKTQQTFHSQKGKRIEVFDLASDIVLYHITTNQLVSCEQLKSADDFETFPAFSPDGKTLYFCSAKVKTIQSEYNQIRYNLCSIPFDATTGKFGNKVDTLISADKMNKSVSFPRPSYDGKYLMYTLSDYGNFSIWHQEADLWLLDLNTLKNRSIKEINSKDTESYHSWSSNSKWIVFSSRRIDGLYTRLYLTSITEEGKFTKPFMLPQKDPNQNEAMLFSYNVPEFVNGKVDLNISSTEHLVNAPKKQVEYRK